METFKIAWLISGLVGWYIVKPPQREIRITDHPMLNIALFVSCVSGGLLTLLFGVSMALKIIYER